jgi:GTP-binding protein
MDWQQEYEDLRREVAAYSGELADKPHCVVFTKLDLLGEEFIPPVEAPGSFGTFAVSAAARTGLDELLAGWWRQLLGIRKTAERREGSVQLP